MTGQKHTRAHMRTAVIFTQILAAYSFLDPKADKCFADIFKKTRMPLWKKGPFNFTQLFEFTMNAFLKYTSENQKANFVQCPNMTERFELTNGTRVFNATLSFHNITFHSFNNIDRIVNFTVHAIQKIDAITDIWIACRDFFVRFCHVPPFSKYFVSDVSVSDIIQPYVRILLRFHARTSKVDVLKTVFRRMDYVRHNILLRPEYAVFKDDIGDILMDNFLEYQQSRLETVLTERLIYAIRKSRIKEGIDVVLFPGNYAKHNRYDSPEIRFRLRSVLQ